MVLVQTRVSRIESPAHTPAFCVPDTRPSWSILTKRKNISPMVYEETTVMQDLHQTLPDPSKLSHEPGHLAMYTRTDAGR